MNPPKPLPSTARRPFTFHDNNFIAGDSPPAAGQWQEEARSTKHEIPNKEAPWTRIWDAGWYGMIMIRRIECVLETRREAFKTELQQKPPDISEADLKKRIKTMETTKLPFYNHSDWTLTKILKESSSQVETNFRNYINSYSLNIDEIIEKFNYRNTVTEIVKAKRLASIIELAADEDFSPERLSNIEMGYVYEELLQKFSQDDAKDTGEHFTPREIIRVMVELMEIDFNPATATKAISIYDPACGTGGMLSIAKEHLIDKAKNDAELKQVEDLILLNGQEYLGSSRLRGVSAKCSVWI